MADATSNGSEPSDRRSEFERFQDLARRLLAVPKAEVDELRKKGERIAVASRRRPSAR